MNYTFNTGKQVLFKDTYEFVECFMKNNQLEYKNIYFNFEDVQYGLDDTQDEKKMMAYKVSQKYPELAKYYFDGKTEGFKNKVPTLTNFPYHTIFVDNPNHIPLLTTPTPSIIKGVTQKIPRPWSFFSSIMIFDGINWSEGINPNPAIYETGIVDDNYERYQSNCILFYRRFDYGTKYNVIEARIEVTDEIESESIRYSDQHHQQLCAYFGVCIHKQMICVPNEKEKEEVLQKKSASEQFVFDMLTKLKTKTLPSDFLIKDDKLRRWEHIHPNGLDSKKAYREVFKGRSFVLKTNKIRGNYYEKITEHNFAIKLSFGIDGSLKCFGGALLIEGYNFQICFDAIERYPQSQEELTVFMKDLFFITEYLEAKLLDYLYVTYGQTPRWYTFPEGFMNPAYNALRSHGSEAISRDFKHLC